MLPFVLLPKGLKFKAHTFCGGLPTYTPFKCDKVFMLDRTTCAKLYVYSFVNALDINSA